MNRIDDSKYLLFIEPKLKEKLASPVEDELTKFMEEQLKNAKEGTSNYSNLSDEGNFVEGFGYKGSHSTECGERSTNKDYLIDGGYITNSLAPFYLKWYRNSIPLSEIMKILSIKNE
jgi:hypothetical protein